MPLATKAGWPFFEHLIWGTGGGSRCKTWLFEKQVRFIMQVVGAAAANTQAFCVALPPAPKLHITLLIVAVLQPCLFLPALPLLRISYLKLYCCSSCLHLSKPSFPHTKTKVQFALLLRLHRSMVSVVAGVAGTW